MAFAKLFERELDKLFRQRTDRLRRELGTTKPGKSPEFRRKNVNSGIRKLQKIASSALARRVKKCEFSAHVGSPKNYQIKGRGKDDKKKRFEKWFKFRFPRGKGIIYAFWGNQRRCLYVGRTGSHGSRPSHHFGKEWFPSAKRIKIYPVKAGSHIPKLECLAIHCFEPKENKIKAAKKKWTKACPLCKTNRYIKKELRSLFRFK